MGLVNGPAELDSGLLQDSEGNIVGQARTGGTGFAVLTTTTPVVCITPGRGSGRPGHGAQRRVVSELAGQQITDPGACSSEGNELGRAGAAAGPRGVLLHSRRPATGATIPGPQPGDYRGAPAHWLDLLTMPGLPRCRIWAPAAPDLHLGRSGSDGDQTDDDAHIDLLQHDAGPDCHRRRLPTGGPVAGDGPQYLSSPPAWPKIPTNADNQHTWDLWTGCRRCPCPAPGRSITYASSPTGPPNAWHR